MRYPYLSIRSAASMLHCALSVEERGKALMVNIVDLIEELPLTVGIVCPATVFRFYVTRNEIAG